MESLFQLDMRYVEFNHQNKNKYEQWKFRHEKERMSHFETERRQLSGSRDSQDQGEVKKSVLELEY